MKTIGITGGVGSGKSAVLDNIEKRYNACILKADELANELKTPGSVCYNELVELLGEMILEEGVIDNRKMAAAIFSDAKLLERVNSVIHPRVKDEILRRMEECRNRGRYELFILEAALLIEEGYDKILDELWYVYADDKVRRQRLREGRGYSDDKITSIMDSQLSDAEFRKHCDRIIDNSGDIEDTMEQIDELLRE